MKFSRGKLLDGRYVQGICYLENDILSHVLVSWKEFEMEYSR